MGPNSRTDGNVHSTLDGTLISFPGVATSSGAGSAIGGGANAVVVGSITVMGTSGGGCVGGPRTNESSVIFEDSAIGGGATGGDSTHVGSSADDGRLCSRGPDRSGPVIVSRTLSVRIISASIAFISGVNCGPRGNISGASSNFSSEASSFTDAGSLTKVGMAGDSCLDILDPKEEVVLLEVPVLQGTSLAGSFPRPFTLSGAIVDVNMLFGFRLRGPSVISGGKAGIGGGGDGGGVEPAKDAVIGGRLYNSGNAGAIEITLVYWGRPGFASESASSPLS